MKKEIEIPFKTRFSLEMLVEFWEKYSETSNSSAIRQLSKSILEKIEEVPELRGFIDDHSILKNHGTLLKEMMSAVFPLTTWNTDACAIGRPFTMDFFFINPIFEKFATVGKKRNGKEYEHKTLHAYASILNQFYGFDIDYRRPIIYEVVSPDTGFKMYFQINIDLQFCKAVPVGEIPELTEKDRSIIINNLDNLEILGSYFPPDSFEFIGMTVLRSIEITEQTIQSDIKNSLLEPDVVTDSNKFTALQKKVVNLLKIHDIDMWLAVLRDNEVLVLNSGFHGHSRCINELSQHFNVDVVKGTVFEKVLKEKQFVSVNDLDCLKGQNPIYDDMISHGKHSVVMGPLIDKDEVLGIFGLSTPESGSFNALNIRQLGEILPLFTVAVKRSMEEFDNRLNNLIQTNFTSIHPSVAWRFRRAAINYTNSLIEQETAVMEEIVFNEIYPLYCVSDIRGSSNMRIHAIQEDLTDHLNMSKEILKMAYKQNSLPAFDELIYRIEKSCKNIKRGLSSGGEIKIINFIRDDIETCFADIESYGDETLSTKLDQYRSAVEENMGTVYRKRKAYDDSVSIINDTISSYLDKVQPEAQLMFPHYFDKQVTDGVDQSIYVGDSLAENRKFSKFHLKNLRLWQFFLLCKLAKKLDELKKEMEFPLDTTHLIVVQDMPISIRFDTDENRFRVDGAYNIRYEIMKKRIDKAVIKTTGERLTQPKMIAIVYSHSTETQDYYEYIDYLVSKGYLKEGVEELDLEDLQGIKGLKALRVEVNCE